MSRAYRISVKESVTREIKAGDEIRTQLELLEILPPEAMAQLLGDELKRRGFAEADDGTLSRKDGAVTITVDPCNGEVAVRAEAKKEVTVQGSKDANAWDDAGPTPQAIAERARQDLRKDLDKRVDKEQERLQSRATDELERHLRDLKPEIGEVVNKVTRAALKQKAAQLGTVTEIAEDEKTGSMTIKVEV